MENKLWGKSLSEGIHAVALHRDRKIGEIEKEIAESLGFAQANVQRWRRGFIPSDEKIVEWLARYITKNSELERSWLDRFLTRARFFEKQRLLEELYPAQASKLAKQTSSKDLLPSRAPNFLGRHEDMAAVIEGLESRWPLISIEGMGGIGKTTLAIEAAWACSSGGTASLERPFEACVFVSAKKKTLMLDDLLTTIARVLNYPYVIEQIAVENREFEVDQILRHERTLIVVDDLESIHDHALIEFLQNIPEPSKVLVTTREAQIRRAYDIHLGGLTTEESIQLIRKLTERNARVAAINQAKDKELKPLADVTGGNPKAIEMALGTVKRLEINLEKLVNELHHAGREVETIFDYIFKSAWERILTQDAKHLLMATSFFVEPISKELLGAAAGLEGYYLDQAIGQLVDLSFLDTVDTLAGPCRYTIHPLTLAFARARFDSAPPNWQIQARQRWLEASLAYAREQFGDEWDDWTRYDSGEPDLPNLLSACRWAFANNFSPLARDLFDELDGFLFIRGMWEEDTQLTGLSVNQARTINDSAELVKWLRKYAWTLVWKDKVALAQELLQEAFVLADAANNADLLRQVFHEQGVLYSRIKDNENAKKYFHRAMEMNLPKQDESSEWYTRHMVEEIYWLGCIAYEEQEYEEAKTQFNMAIGLAGTIKWIRAKAYSLNYLADIERRAGNITQAHRYLDEGLPVALGFKDQRRIGFFKLSYAELAKTEGDVQRALEYGYDALDLFSRLGMRQEIEETRQLLNGLNGTSNFSS